MAKITNPLMSFSASGTFGKKLAFRATRAGSVCADKPTGYAQRSPAMLANQQRMRDAHIAFLTLTTTDRAHWQALAVVRNYGIWPVFFAEYNYQMVVAPAMPLIPEAYLR